MHRKSVFTFIAIYSLVAGIGFFASSETTDATTKTVEETVSFIVEADSVEVAESAVRAVGGKITHVLGIIDAVAADITPSQVARLNTLSNVRLSSNAKVETAGKPGVVVIHMHCCGQLTDKAFCNGQHFVDAFDGYNEAKRSENLFAEYLVLKPFLSCCKEEVRRCIAQVAC